MSWRNGILCLMKEASLIATLESKLSAQAQQIQQLLQQITVLTTQNASLQKQLDTLLRTLYGVKSERKKETAHQDCTTLKKSNTEQKETSEKKKPSRNPLPDNLPREKIIYDLTEAERACKQCGTRCHCIGKEITEQLEYIPGRLFVKQHIRYKYGCKLGCSLKIPPLPAQPIEKGITGAGLLADVLISKYQDAMPLYRQALRFKRHHVVIAESTLCDWVAASATLLAPLVALMKKQLVQTKKLHSDDTPVPVLSKGKTKQGRLWVYVADGSHQQAMTVYDYTPTRSQSGPVNFLKEFRGYLQADAYSGYDILYRTNAIIEVGCLAHARRKFFEVSVSTKADNVADEALSLIGKIYTIEKQIKHFGHQKRYYYRKQYSKPLYHALHRWLVQKQKTVIPSTPIAKAINYALNHWRALQNVLADGCLEVDNNTAERAIKPVVIGRKNYLFAGSDEGGKRAAIIYSLIETCKQNEINSFDYLRDVLTRLPSQLANKLDELLPYNWKTTQS